MDKLGHNETHKVATDVAPDTALLHWRCIQYSATKRADRVICAERLTRMIPVGSAFGVAIVA